MTARAATSFSVEDTGRAAVVRATGEVDTASATAFRAALERAVGTGRPLVVVDLAAVSFLDSAGLSVVFGVQRELPVDRQLVLGNVPTRMLRTLRLDAVPSVVTVHPQGEPQPWAE
jgi:anti-sigma B factor antagonist